MGKPRGFLEIRRSKNDARPVGERLGDHREIELSMPEPKLREQAARCMDCGIPFCHRGCPLGNLIPDWNDAVMHGRFGEAASLLASTNNFPEITGRVCPAPCEGSCVLGMDVAGVEPVTIKTIEREIADRAMASGPWKPERAPIRSGRRVAVIGSGPAGLACAQELARRGHEVIVYEKSDRIGGLLRYGIPDFKLEKKVVDARVTQLRAEGVTFRTGVEIGAEGLAELRARHAAIVLAIGASVARELEVPGRSLGGVHLAMSYLEQENRRIAGDRIEPAERIDARGKHVIVIGGGDTGSDCVGTAHRQGAASVTSLELMPAPPSARAPSNPWPEWPLIMRSSTSHEEGGVRAFGVRTRALLGDDAGHVRALAAERVGWVDGALRVVEAPDAPSAIELPAQLVLLAMGFVSPRRAGLVDALGVATDARGNVLADRTGATSAPGVFVAGDAHRGASLVVWAIAEGREVAAGVDRYLSEGRSTPSASA
jgi:glutamate synthase (NADPH/NADH) small chain